MIGAAATGVALLLKLSVPGALVARRAGGPAPIHAAGAALCALLALVGAAFQLGGSGPAALTLPLGVPWLGAHLRIDALAAVFLLLLGIGGAAAGVFAIG